MAFVTAQGISGLAVSLLTRTLVLPMTVARIPGGDFAGDNGDTITVRVRQPRTAQTQTAGQSINYTAINEVSVDVSLAHLYDATRVSEEDLSLSLVDFGVQVTQPQVASVAVGAEDQLATAMNAATADAVSVDPAAIDDTLLAAREALSTADVPASDRFLAVAPDMMTALLGTDKFVRADAIGDGAAIQTATVGRIYGMTVVESNGLTAGTGLAYHRSGFAFANRTPVGPSGGAGVDTATTTSGGVGMRSVIQYQPDLLSRASVLHTFAGANVVDVDRIYKFTTDTA